ncbi:MAG TPA: CARDB domain-containing protein [Methylomirabilota bacterium]|nr:CARDB domain-containing protein [Methylomirabilota bacterium]
MSATPAGQVTIPARVIIPAGETAVTVPISGAVDGNVDGDVNVTVRGTAGGFEPASGGLIVEDNDEAQLTIIVGAEGVAEGGRVNAMVRRNASAASALLVKLSSTLPEHISLPATVTIAAGQASAAFEITALSNDLPDGNLQVNLTASAENYGSGGGSIEFLDNDVPTLTLALSEKVISEGKANPAAELTITRSIVTDQEIFVLLSSSESGAATLPFGVSIPANEASARVKVNVTDDTTVDGSQTTRITAYVTDAVYRAPIEQGSAFVDVTVIDNDGPTLLITFNQDIISETGSGIAVVSRNTNPTNALTVALSSLDTGEATTPATVVIPVGATSAEFTVTGVKDNQPDGLQRVSIRATANGYTSGESAIGVTDIDLPDIRVVNATVPAGGLTSSSATIGFTVRNDGIAEASGPWFDRIYLSTSPGGENLQPVGQVLRTGRLAIGATYDRNAVIALPTKPGTYYVVIVTDADEVLSEGGKLNNTHIARTPIVVNPAYRATVQAQLESAPAGTPIPLRGRAFKANNEPAPNVGVTVRLTVQGIRREIPVRTDAQGNFETVFRPFLNEAGRVTVGADHPGVEEDPAQDGFDLHGVRFRQDELNLVLFPTEEVTGEIPIENLADLPASGLAFTLEGVPAGVTMQLRPTSTSLSPLNQRMVAYTIVAGPRTNRLDLRAAIKMTTAQGAVAYLPLNVTVAPHQPVLVANPGFLYTGMLRGTQKIVEFEVSNTGGAQSGPVTLMVPPVAWLKAASETNLPSIKPGETVKFALSLTPPANMPLERFDGSVLVRAENASVEVPFQFRAISEARGDFKIEVRDDYTYNVKGEPKVQGATVRLNDGLSGDLIASGVTGADGTLTLTNLMEGSYQLTVTAEKHGNYRTPITIVPGILTEHSAFIDVQTVSYRWTVVPTHIEDRYQVVLEPVFETEVPVPVVTIDNPLMLPLIVEGRETQFEVRLSNHGLIQAEKISIELPEHPEVEFRSLVDVVEVLPAKSSIAIPIIAKAKPGAQFASYPSARERMIRLASRSSFTGCEEVPKLQAKWSYVCGPDRRWHSNGGEIGFVSVDEDCWDKIKDHAGEAAGGNPKDLMDLKGQALGLAGVLADCVDPCLGTIVNLALGVATRDAKGAIGAAMGMGNCICPEIPYTGTPTGGGIPYVHGWVSGGGSGGGGSYDYPTPAPVNWAWPEFPCNPGDEIGGEASLSVAGINALSTTSSPGSVCARVRLRIEQEAVITRAAFLGTLEIENGNDLTTLSNIQVSIDIRAVSQESAADMFATRGPELKGITSVDGSGMLAPGAVGSAQYTFIPRREAAANGPTVYKIGGTLRYTEGTNVVEAPLLPDTITVYPDPVLNLVYFQQRDVYSDDPHTDPIEPAEPFALGLLVKNSGKGAALNFKITSGQPKIIENEKGLLIDFKIIGTQVGDQPATPSLSADLGRIEAGEGKVAIWNMISTLQGKFVEYNATFEHIDGLGDKRLSLIDSVEVHELIHVVRGDRPIDDTVADFLVNDQPDPNNTPDAIYFSHNGSVSPVNTAANVQVEVQQDGVTAKLTGSATTGWNYFKALDPMGGLRLYKVTRSDNKQVQLGFNAWTTSRSFPASQAGARYENLVHIVDFNSTGSYTLHYRFYDGSVPSVLGITPLAAVQNAAVDSIEVEFSKEIDLATLTRADLELTLNGVTNTSAFNVTATLVRPGVYQISGLAGATSGDGNYTVTIRGAGVADATGAAGSGVATVRWAKSSGAPVVAQLTEFDPIVRRAPVTSVQVQFSEAIDATTFDSADLALRLNGGVNLSSALAVITKVDDTTFNITGLGAVSAAEGEYSLTINAAGVKTPAGVAGKGALTTRWVVDANGPQVVELEKPSTNPRNIVVPSLEVRFNEPIDAATFTHADVSLTRNGGANLVTSAVSVARITDTRYRIENFNWVSGLEGNYVLTVNAAGISDPAGNPGRGTASTSWTLDLGKPAAPVRLAISPDLGASSSDALTSAKSVTFTGSVSETNLTVRLYDISTRADLGPATVSGTNFTKALELTAGQHRIRVHASDSAANVSGDSFLDVFVDLVGPNAALQEIDTLRSNGLPALEITFNEAIHAATFTKADVTLSREGIAVSLPASAEILFASSNTYRISGLATVTDTPGLYNLSVDLKGVQDLAGNSGSTNVSRTWRRVGANTPPSLAAISSKVVGADTLLVFTNSASDADIPRNRLRFTLEPGAPAGAAVNATNGVFTWRPTRAQAAQTFHVAIRVTDDGSPALSDVKSFTVQVTDYVDARVGQSVVLAGASGSVPLEIFSSAALTNITFTFSAPAELRGVQVEGWVPEIANVELVQGAGAPASHGLWSARISAATGKVFQGNQTLAQIQFTSAQSDRSMFANVRLQQVVASKPDGTTVGTTYLKSGRVVILHSEPILEAELGAGGSRRVRLFGRADASYRLQTSNRLNPGGVWGNGELIEVDPALLMQEISLPNGAGLIFYRAVKAAPGPLLPGSDALLIE